jgi:8-amino-7-oxononanoate synthase
MLDFTSALYLDLRHGSGSLLPWPTLTSGRPAALGELPGAAAIATSIAKLQGCDTGALGPSTLHLFWDFFGGVDPARSVICLDRGTYPVARWGVERAAARGVPVHVFGHHDPDGLQRILHRRSARNRTPIVVFDGFCPSCGTPAPVNAYLAVVRDQEGLLVLDDTQALGILGEKPSAASPYGTGGGGSLRNAGVPNSSTIVLSSLAKAFGTPIAAISGSVEMIAAFVARSETRVHCSAPSAAALHAAARALTINDAIGERLRDRLWRLVRRFQALLREAGLSASGGLFPVQSVAPASGRDPVNVHARLLEAGVRTLLWKPHGQAQPRIGFIFTAKHQPEQLHHAVSALTRATAPRQWVLHNGRTEETSAL